MHRETILRIEDSLRATADGTLHWLQGYRVQIPVVDQRTPAKEGKDGNNGNNGRNGNDGSGKEGKEGRDVSSSVKKGGDDRKQAGTSPLSLVTPPLPPSFPSSSSSSSSSAYQNGNKNDNENQNDQNGQDNQNNRNRPNLNSKYSEPLEIRDPGSLTLESIPLPHRPDSMPTTPTNTPPSRCVRCPCIVCDVRCLCTVCDVRCPCTLSISRVLCVHCVCTCVCMCACV